jgi:hypothetical protein
MTEILCKWLNSDVKLSKVVGNNLVQLVKVDFFFQF